MIRVSKYPGYAVLGGLILMFASKWRFHNVSVQNAVLMVLWGLGAAWALKYGIEGLGDRKKITGKPNDGQRAGYYISIGQAVGGLIALLYLIFFLLFQSPWRIFTCAESWGFGMAPR